MVYQGKGEDRGQAVDGERDAPQDTSAPDGDAVIKLEGDEDFKEPDSGEQEPQIASKSTLVEKDEENGLEPQIPLEEVDKLETSEHGLGPEGEEREASEDKVEADMTMAESTDDKPQGAGLTGLAEATVVQEEPQPKDAGESAESSVEGSGEVAAEPEHRFDPAVHDDSLGPPPPPPPPSKSNRSLEHVDVDLGSQKAVSRNHARIGYWSGLGCFCLEIMGRNGAWVDDRYYVAGSTVPLTQG